MSMEKIKDRVSLRLPDDVKALLERLIELKSKKGDFRVEITSVISDCIRYGAKLVEQDIESNLSIPSQTLPESQRLVLVAKQIFEKHLQQQHGEAA